MLKNSLSALLSITLATSAQASESVNGQVISVGDGDTLTAQINGQQTRVRLACIDAAEMAQIPYGRQARNQLQTLLPRGSQISLRVTGQDRYGRSISEIYQGSTSINLLMVQQGQAVIYPQYLDQCLPELQSALQSAQNQAQQSRLGFWNQANPVMPYTFRRQN